MAVFFLKNYRKSSAFKYIITLFFLLGLLMSVLSIFFLNSIVSEFVPSSIKIIHYPKQILEDIYNFAWASIAIYLPVLAVAFFASTSLSSDLESKNIYQFMTMPISKEEYLFSKILSSFVASIISVLVFIAMQFITYLLIFRSFRSFCLSMYHQGHEEFKVNVGEIVKEISMVQCKKQSIIRQRQNCAVCRENISQNDE